MNAKVGLILLAALGIVAVSVAARPRGKVLSEVTGITLALRSGSRLLPDGSLEPGQPAASGDFSGVVARAERAFMAIPSEVRPRRPVLDFEPRYAPGVTAIDSIEYHRAARSIVIGENGAQAGSEMWLHEFAHVRLAGARPKGELARRFTDAIEEGFADYFAAVIAKTPLLGDGPHRRDLRTPPRIGPSEWASLAFRGFDTHRMGWGLAARLYALEPEGGDLLRDVVASFDGESAVGVASDNPAAVIRALLRACPAKSRARLSRVLQSWLPSEIFPVEIPR
jgi:hypothetical protein